MLDILGIKKTEVKADFDKINQKINYLKFTMEELTKD